MPLFFPSLRLNLYFYLCFTMSYHGPRDNGEGRVGPAERTLPPPASAPRSVPISESLRVAWFLNRNSTSTAEATPRTTTTTEDDQPEATTPPPSPSIIQLLRRAPRPRSRSPPPTREEASDQEHLGSPLRFKKQQWQLSLPSSQHWKLFLDILYVHMSISCCHTIALYQHSRRLMTRLKRTFRLQTLSDLPKKKVFFLEGRNVASMFSVTLALHLFIPLVHLRDHLFFFHHVLLQAQTTLTS